MVTCPVCGRPAQLIRHHQQRATCGKACGYVISAASHRARNAQVDAMAVERLVTGHPVESTRGERLTATAILVRRGYSQSMIAAMLRVNVRSVARYSAELNLRKDAA
jgi:predicted nucleic acid-binding Zn ribbon protein